MPSAPKETTLMGALVDAVFGSSSTLASQSAVSSEQEVTEMESFLQPNEDGLVVEFCTTFATEASETVAVVPPTAAAAALVTENSILPMPPVAVGSATETTTTTTTTTGQSSSTTPTDSSEQDEEEPMTGFLSRFFRPQKNRTESADSGKEFHIEEIAIADDSKDEYDEELETSTIEDSDDDESECSDSSSKQSFIYEAASTMDHRSATPFLGSSTSSFSVAEQSAVTSRASSVSFTESRDAYNDFESRASSLSYAETRDDRDTALGSMSSETTTFDEEDYESIAEIEEKDNGVEAPQTVTLKVSELMANATIAEEATKPNSILPKPALKKLNQVRKWFPWQMRSKRGSKRSSSGGSRTLEVIEESEEDEVMSMIESMNIVESDARSTKRKTQSEDFDSNKKKYKTAASPQAGEALSHFGVEWEMISFNSKSHKRFMPWSRRLSAKDKTFVAIVNERAEL